MTGMDKIRLTSESKRNQKFLKIPVDLNPTMW